MSGTARTSIVRPWHTYSWVFDVRKITRRSVSSVLKSWKTKLKYFCFCTVRRRYTRRHDIISFHHYPWAAVSSQHPANRIQSIDKYVHEAIELAAFTMYRLGYDDWPFVNTKNQLHTVEYDWQTSKGSCSCRANQIPATLSSFLLQKKYSDMQAYWLSPLCFLLHSFLPLIRRAPSSSVRLFVAVRPWTPTLQQISQLSSGLTSPSKSSPSCRRHARRRLLHPQWWHRRLIIRILGVH